MGVRSCDDDRVPPGPGGADEAGPASYPGRYAQGPDRGAVVGGDRTADQHRRAYRRGHHGPCAARPRLRPGAPDPQLAGRDAALRLGDDDRLRRRRPVLHPHRHRSASSGAPGAHHDRAGRTGRPGRGRDQGGPGRAAVGARGGGRGRRGGTGDLAAAGGQPRTGGGPAAAGAGGDGGQRGARRALPVAAVRGQHRRAGGAGRAGGDRRADGLARGGGPGGVVSRAPTTARRR